MTKTLNIYTGGNGSAGTLVGSSTSTALSSFAGGNSVTWTFAAGLALTDNVKYSAIVATGGGISFTDTSGNPYPNGGEVNGTINEDPSYDAVFRGNFSATPPVTAIPFEFETTGGLVILGGAWLLRKRLQQQKSSEV